MASYDLFHPSHFEALEEPLKVMNGGETAERRCLTANITFFSITHLLVSSSTPQVVRVGSPGYEENRRLLDEQPGSPEILARLEELRKALLGRKVTRGPTDDKQRAFYESEAEEPESEAEAEESLDMDIMTAQGAQVVHRPPPAFTHATAASPNKKEKLRLARAPVFPVKAPLHHVRRHNRDMRPESDSALNRAISGESCCSLDSLCADPS